MKKSVFLILAVAFASSVQAVRFERVLVRQQWPWSGKVHIDFVLAGTDGKAYDIDVKLKSGNKLLDTPATSLSGSRFSAKAGANRIVWDPSKTSHASENKVYDDITVELNATDVDSKRYLIIDMTKGAENDKEPEIWPVTYSSDIVDADNDGKWDKEYKTTKMVFRRIEPGTFTMGAPASEVRKYNYSKTELEREITITKPFYMAVFEFTAQQFYQIWAWRCNNTYGKTEATGARPAINISYNYLRGSHDNGINFPSTGNEVYDIPDVTKFCNKNGYKANTISTIGWFRRHVPGLKIDLPTEAQWEYCCRAGTTTPFNNSTTHTVADAPFEGLDPIGRYKYNSLKYDESQDKWADPKDDSQFVYGIAEVGSLDPNEWGLYDMHGNVAEWVRDWTSEKDPADLTDPQGATTGKKRCFRGGCYMWGPAECRSASVSGDDPSKSYINIGCRFMIPVE
jgi:formylglycine-generating enzyme required for sulfatase activity